MNQKYQILKYSKKITNLKYFITNKKKLFKIKQVIFILIYYSRSKNN